MVSRCLHKKNILFFYKLLCLTVIQCGPFSASLLTESKVNSDPNYQILTSQGSSNNTKQPEPAFLTISSTTETAVRSENSTLKLDSSNLPHLNNTEKNNTGVVALTTTVIPKRKKKPPVKKSPPLTEEDQRVRKGWGGNCMAAHWKKCSKIVTWFGDYFDNVKKPDLKNLKKFDIDCKVQPIICLKNGWSVTRCQILCMSRCNKKLMVKYDKYVAKDGMCKT